MSIWTSPCYSVEPLRNVANNLPLFCSGEIPECVKGISNFHFGKCEISHPELSEKLAWNAYKDDPRAWERFVRAGRKNLSGRDALQFYSTLCQTNCEFAGIRAVYWAFKHFYEDDWVAKETFSAEELIEFTSKAAKLAAAPSRINQESWDDAHSWYSDEASWAVAEAKADSVRFLWTIKTSQRLRKIKSSKSRIYEKTFGAKFVKADVSNDAEQEVDNKAFARMIAPKFSAVDHEIKVRELNVKIKEGMQISKMDALAVCTLPYVSLRSKFGRLVVFPFRGGLILYDKVEMKGGIFFEKDWDRLTQMLQSHAKLLMYYEKYEASEKTLSMIMKAKYLRIMDGFLRQVDLTSDYKCNRYCRAYDVYQFVFLAEISSDVTDHAVQTQLAKVQDEELNSVVNMEEYLAIVSDEELGVKESLELLKFNKIFPCPDFCTYSVCDSLHEKALNTHPCEEEVTLGTINGNDIKASHSEFKLYMKRNRVITFERIHSFLPGKLKEDQDLEIPDHLLSYPEIPVHKLLVSDMAFIDIKGCFDYRSFEGSEDELIKDKVIAPDVDRDSEEPLSKMNPIERNQVLKYLFSKVFKGQDEIFTLFSNGELFTRWKNWILLALKAESKKPGSRAFSMARDALRRILSEIEANIAKYVKHQPGSSVGKTTKDLDKRMAEIADTPMMDTMTNTFPVIFSFDLVGFSPQQNRVFKEMGNDSWADCFGKDEIRQLWRIFEGVEMTFDKFGVRDSFVSLGNDLEGFQGKMNTSVHIDLMGYCVYKLKQLGLSGSTAKLEVLIDDGLLRLPVVMREGNIEKSRLVIEAMYSMMGQKISWDKTFISRVMCQYLNRVYYDGIEVTPGAKAFMRIGKKLESAVPTIADELMAHGSTTRGAIQSGANHFLAYRAYLVEIFKTLRRWGMGKLNQEELRRMSFAIYIPIGLGGFSVQSLFGLSTNESFGSLQAGLAQMKMICHSFNGYAKMANVYINAGVRPMSPEAVMRNPTAMRTNYRCLNLRRFANSAKDKVIATSERTLIKMMRLGVADGVEDALLETFFSGKKLSDIKRKCLWEMSLVSHLETVVGKLQNSRTAAAILGQKKCIRIYIANRMEAKKLISETVRGSLVVRGN